MRTERLVRVGGHEIRVYRLEAERVLVPDGAIVSDLAYHASDVEDAIADMDQSSAMGFMVELILAANRAFAS